MIPTKEQIEKYIQAADTELGPFCTEEWVQWCRNLLRTAPLCKGPYLHRQPDGTCFGFTIEVTAGGGGGGGRGQTVHARPDAAPSDNKEGK